MRVLIGAWVLVAAGCGAPPHAAAPAQSAIARTPAARAAGACSSVQTTTAIEQVSASCQALWAPYGVTRVPASNELEVEHVPPAPAVANMTGGSVSDATAQTWADASNRDSGWWKWAERNDQLFMLRNLVGPVLIPAAEVEAMQNGGTVDQPDCNLYPISWKLFAAGADGKAYFARRNEPVRDSYVFVVVYSGPCSETVKQPDGRSTAIVDFIANTTVFSPGTYRNDPVLGGIWFADAGGNCQDPAGPPASWCGR